jgi:hypothetical protein
MKIDFRGIRHYLVSELLRYDKGRIYSYPVELPWILVLISL